MLFEQKKISLETLSEYLRSVRESAQFSLPEVSAKTGIKLKFLQDLEEGKFQSLPPEVYVAGFLRQLSLLYRIEPEALIAQYKKELGIQKQLGNPKAPAGSPLRRGMKNVIITPKNLSIGLGILFVVFTLAYIVWQVFSINRTPTLEIASPQDHQVIADSFVNIAGKTDPGMAVTINNEPVFVDKDGNFKKQLGLTAGPKNLVFVAKNKFDKTVSQEVDVLGASSATAFDGQLQLKLDFSADAQVSVVIDGDTPQAMAFHAGDSKIFSGSSKISVSTSDAGATKVTLNNKVLGPLGRPGEALSDIPFFADSAGLGTTTKP